MADELATPEELAARKARADADRPDRSPYEALAESHEHLTDDELAERIASHPDRDVLLSLWRRQRGDVAAEKRDEAAVKRDDDAVKAAQARQAQRA